jgi:hypothetical protein
MPWFACDFECADDGCATLVAGPALPEPVGDAACGSLSHGRVCHLGALGYNYCRWKSLIK